MIRGLLILSLALGTPSSMAFCQDSGPPNAAYGDSSWDAYYDSIFYDTAYFHDGDEYWYFPLEQDVADSLALDSSMSIYDLARMLIDQQRNYDSAIVMLQEYIQVNDHDAEALYLLGFAYDQKDNVGAAIDYYRRSISMDSTSYGPHRDLAYLFDIFAQYDSMNYHMIRAIACSYNPESLYYDLGYSFDMIGQRDSALTYYHRALDYDSLDSDALLNIGAIWIDWGNVDSARYYTEKVLNFSPERPDAWYNYGVISATLDDKESAIGHFKKALGLNSGMVEAKLRLGDLYEAEGDSAMARIYYQEFVEGAPYLYWDDIIRIKEKLGNYH